MTTAISTLFAHDPPYFLHCHYDMLLTHTAENDISDLTLQIDSPIFAVRYGQQIKLTDRGLSGSEIEDFINFFRVTLKCSVNNSKDCVM